MTFEERLEAAERRRLEGNALLAGERHDEALGKYRWVGGQRGGGRDAVCVVVGGGAPPWGARTRLAARPRAGGLPTCLPACLAIAGWGCRTSMKS